MGKTIGGAVMCKRVGVYIVGSRKFYTSPAFSKIAGKGDCRVVVT